MIGWNKLNIQIIIDHTICNDTISNKFLKFNIIINETITKIRKNTISDYISNHSNSTFFLIIIHIDISK